MPIQQSPNNPNIQPNNVGGASFPFINNTPIAGEGVKFPVEVNSIGDLSGVADPVSVINQSIHLILSTRIGERLFNPSFGSSLYKVLFSPITAPTIYLIKLYTADAVSRWEPRIKVVNVLVDDSITNVDNNTVGIVINYIIRQTNTPANYVYPFQIAPMPVSQLDSNTAPTFAVNSTKGS